MVCRQWNHYVKSLEGYEIEYGDCPQKCVRFKQNSIEQYDIYRRDLCNTCPKRTAKTQYERRTVAEFEIWLKPNDLAKISFAKTFECLKTVLAVKDLPADKMTAKTANLVGIFESEKVRYERITRDAK